MSLVIMLAMLFAPTQVEDGSHESHPLDDDEIELPSNPEAPTRGTVAAAGATLLGASALFAPAALAGLGLAGVSGLAVVAGQLQRDPVAATLAARYLDVYFTVLVLGVPVAVTLAILATMATPVVSSALAWVAARTIVRYRIPWLTHALVVAASLLATAALAAALAVVLVVAGFVGWGLAFVWLSATLASGGSNPFYGPVSYVLVFGALGAWAAAVLAGPLSSVVGILVASVASGVVSRLLGSARDDGTPAYRDAFYAELPYPIR